MALEAILGTILGHPFQVLLVVVATFHAVRGAVASVGESWKPTTPVRRRLDAAACLFLVAGVLGSSAALAEPVPSCVGIASHGANVPMTAGEVPSGFEPPRPSKTNAPPSYPRVVLKREAIVTLRFLVDRDGSVRDPSVVDGEEPFASAVIRAAKGWRYEPARQRGSAIAVRSTIRVRFDEPPQKFDRWWTFRRQRPVETVVCPSA